jgi:hypothetical protein
VSPNLDRDIIADILNLESIEQSQRAFDIGGPAIVEEEPSEPQQEDAPFRLQTVEDDSRFVGSTPVSVRSNSDYNQQYAYYLSCQSISALVAFDEGWKAFKDLVLLPYVAQRINEDQGYSGDDPHKAFALRCRRREAELFARCIIEQAENAADVPKPVLSAKV